MDETVREHLGRMAFEAGEKYFAPRRNEIYGYEVEKETWESNWGDNESGHVGRERYCVMAEAVVMAYFEPLRQELSRLNDLRYKVVATDKFRKGIADGESPRVSVNVMQGVNPDHATWDDLHREVAALEERIVRETGFGVEYRLHPTLGEEAGTYVLMPKNESWLEAKRQHG